MNGIDESVTVKEIIPRRSGCRDVFSIKESYLTFCENRTLLRYVFHCVSLFFFALSIVKKKEEKVTVDSAMALKKKFFFNVTCPFHFLDFTEKVYCT